MGGPLAGTRFALRGPGAVSVGSGADCAVRVDLPAVSALHALVDLDAGGAFVRDARSPRGVYVNDERVVERAGLREGDILWLGPPGEKSSVMLRCGPAPAPAAAPPAAAGTDDPGFFFEPEAAPAAQTSPAPAPRAAEPALDDTVFFFAEPPPGGATEAAAPPPAAPPVAPPPRATPVVPASTPPSVARPAPPRAPAAAGAAREPPGPTATPAAVLKTIAPTAEASRPATTARTAPPPATPTPPRGTGEVPAGRPAARRPVEAERPAVATPRAATAAPTPRRGVPPVATARPAAPPATAATGASSAGSTPRGRHALRPLLLAAAFGALALLATAGFLAYWFLFAPALAAVAPARAHSAQVVTLSGRRFGSTPGANVVLFGGRRGRVVRAAPDRLEVEVPELSIAPGADVRVPVTVTVGGRTTRPVELAVFFAARLAGLSPDVALPGEEVELAGSGFGPGAVVRFGTVQAEILDLQTERMRVRVPAIPGPFGTAAPVTVAMNGAESNPGPFYVGRLPLVIEVRPTAAAPGDAVTITGRGFRPQAGAVAVRVDGRPALVVEATDTGLRAVVPWGAGQGAVTIEVQPPGSVGVAQGTLNLPALPARVEFRFAAEPLEGSRDSERAAVSTELGPAFVLAAADGKTAAVRALEAATRLNAAAAALKASLEADVELRFGTVPSLGLYGRNETLVAVTAEDAAGYGKDAAGRPATPGRLASWWSAVARDLVLLLLRGEAPRHAAALAGEGRALLEAYQAAQRLGEFGVPRRLVAEMRPPLRTALRGLGERLPAAVGERAGAEAPAAPAALRLEGTWSGSEVASEGRRAIAVTFTRNGGTFNLESGLGVSVPLRGLDQPQRGSVRFSLALGGGMRYYQGRWDGRRLSGGISSDPAGRQALGTFELAPRF